MPHRSPDAELPADFESVRTDSGATLLLPRRQAEELRTRQLQRRAAELELQAQERELAEQRMREARAAAALVPSAAAQPAQRRAPYGPQPEPGWYRVLPALDKFLEELDDPAKAVRSADKDVNERRERILNKLGELGPDRRLAQSPSWRQDLLDLEATLPHFRDPIRLLRNTMALTEATGVPARIPPMLLLGPPGVGKTHFSHRVAELLGAPHASVQFATPSYGGQLLGSDKAWGNSEPGLLFNLLCLGTSASPVVLLDEMDKAGGSGYRQQDPLAQLHGTLEPETARRTVDISMDVEFDASLVTYVGTANSVHGIGAPLLSRMEVFSIAPPSRDESFAIAESVVGQVLKRFGLAQRLVFERRAVHLLAHLSPRLMTRATAHAAAAAVADGRARVSEDALWAELQPGAARGLH